MQKPPPPPQIPSANERREAINNWMYQFWAWAGNGGAGTAQIVGSSPITVTTGTSSFVISHATSGVVAGTYGSPTVIPQLGVNALGHVTFGSNVGTLGTFAGFSSLVGAGDVLGTSTTGTFTGALSTTGVAAGTYGAAGILAQLIVDAKGRLTGASQAGTLGTFAGFNSFVAAGIVTGTTTTGTLTTAETKVSVGDVLGTSTTGTFTAALSTTGVAAGTYSLLAVDVKGRVASGGIFTSGTSLTLSGTLRIDDVTDSTSILTGSVQTDGGLGVTKALWVGGLANIAGAVTLQSTLTISGGSMDFAAISKIVPGATSLSLRNNANTADNILITDAGAVTMRSTLGVTGGITRTSTSAATAASMEFFTSGGNSSYIGREGSTPAFGALANEMFLYNGGLGLKMTYSATPAVTIPGTLGVTGAITGNLTGNVTGNVSGSSGSTTGNAATVTTNANLTGHVTSTGNAAVLGSFTLAQLNTAISDADVTTLASAVSAAWPVGSIFMSISATNPATLLGIGTWVRFGEGKMLVSQQSTDADFDVAEETGGSKTHTQTAAELATHTHTQDAHNHTQDTHTHTDSGHAHAERGLANGGTTFPVSSGVVAAQIGGATTESASAVISSNIATNQAATATNQNTGSSTAMNIMNPYIVVYMWKRTA